MPAAVAALTHYAHGITAIDTDYVRPAFDASHLLVSPDSNNGRRAAAFVDTGTDYAVPLLLDALSQQALDVADVKYVFLTHVHLDHAGGAGRLLKALPNARAVLHPRGAPHMIDPSRLVAGTIAVYGEQRYRDIYRDVASIPASRIDIADDGATYTLGNRALRAFFTEGHARHHYCLHDAGAAAVFCGDSFGVSYRELDSLRGEFIFPSTTPIDFDPLEAHRTVDRIMACKPRHLYLTHYAEVTASERLAADMHRGIDYFAELAQQHAAHSDRRDRMRDDMFLHFRDALLEHGYRGGEDRLHEILDFDIRLNSLGLDVWLQRSGKNA